jgi:hypothetical protein
VANDATTASAILIEEADRRDWCGDYDAIITRINGRITAFQFDDRVISYNASRRVEVTVSFWVTQSGSYEGRGEPDEDDVDWNEVDNYEVHEVLRSLTRGDYDFQVDDDTTQDFETEVSES